MFEVNSQKLNNSIGVTRFIRLLSKHEKIAITVDKKTMGYCLKDFDGVVDGELMLFSDFKKKSKSELQGPIRVKTSGRALNEKWFYYISAGA